MHVTWRRYKMLCNRRKQYLTEDLRHDPTRASIFSFQLPQCINWQPPRQLSARFLPPNFSRGSCNSPAAENAYKRNPAANIIGRTLAMGKLLSITVTQPGPAGSSFDAAYKTMSVSVYSGIRCSPCTGRCTVRLGLLSLPPRVSFRSVPLGRVGRVWRRLCLLTSPLQCE